MFKEKKDRITSNILHEYEMRKLNSKDAMLDYLENYLVSFFDLPEGILKLEKGNKQMSLEIFEKYVCFDYPNDKIEVRYTPKKDEEIFVGSIIFTKSPQRPIWENVKNEKELFDINIVDSLMEMAFSSFTD